MILIINNADPDTGAAQILMYEVGPGMTPQLVTAVTDPDLGSLYGALVFPNGDFVVANVAPTPFIAKFVRQSDGSYVRGPMHDLYANLDALPTGTTAVAIDNDRYLAYGLETPGRVSEVSGLMGTLQLQEFITVLNNEALQPLSMQMRSEDELRIVGRGNSSAWNRLYSYPRNGEALLLAELEFGYQGDPMALFSDNRLVFSKFQYSMRVMDQNTGQQDNAIALDFGYPLGSTYGATIASVPSNRYLAVMTGDANNRSFQIFDTTEVVSNGDNETFRYGAIDASGLPSGSGAFLLGLAELDGPGPEPEPTCFWTDISSNLVQDCEA